MFTIWIVNFHTQRSQSDNIKSRKGQKIAFHPKQTFTESMPCIMQLAVTARCRSFHLIFAASFSQRHSINKIADIRFYISVFTFNYPLSWNRATRSTIRHQFLILIRNIFETPIYPCTCLSVPVLCAAMHVRGSCREATWRAWIHLRGVAIFTSVYKWGSVSLG